MNRLNLNPVIETMPRRRIVGLRRRYTMETRMAIPGQWGEYNADEQALSDAVPDAWYGVCAEFGEDGSFDYLCGQEAARRLSLPGGRRSRCPQVAGRGFATTAHISAMQEMWSEIYREWMGTDRLTPRDGPSTKYYPPVSTARRAKAGMKSGCRSPDPGSPFVPGRSGAVNGQFPAKSDAARAKAKGGDAACDQ